MILRLRQLPLLAPITLTPRTTVPLASLTGQQVPQTLPTASAVLTEQQVPQTLPMASAVLTGQQVPQTLPTASAVLTGQQVPQTLPMASAALTLLVLRLFTTKRLLAQPGTERIKATLAPQTTGLTAQIC
jgi:hypothetical protein